MLRKINVFLPDKKPPVFSKIHAKGQGYYETFLAKTVSIKPMHIFYLNLLFMWTLCKDGQGSCYKLGFMKKCLIIQSCWLWKTSSNANHTWSCGRSMFFCLIAPLYLLHFRVIYQLECMNVILCHFLLLIEAGWIVSIGREMFVVFLLHLSWRFHETAEFAKFSGKIVEFVMLRQNFMNSIHKMKTTPLFS